MTTPGTVLLKRLERAYSIVVGPATIIAVAYIDPGNFASNMEAGARYGLDLLWVVWLSGLIAILFQYMAGKLGALRGASLYELIAGDRHGIESRGGLLRRSLAFVAVLVIVLATDMAELLGILLGLEILTGLPIELLLPLVYIDVLLLMLFIDRLDYFEKIISVLVTVVGLSIVYELVLVRTDLGEVFVHSMSLSPASLAGDRIVVASSIIGATVMPHALILHSYIARDKWFSREEPKTVLREHTRDTVLNLVIASIFNASLQIMSYYMLYKAGIHEVSIENSHLVLEPLYGRYSVLVFGIALLASGIASSIVSIQTSVYTYESFSGRRVSRALMRTLIRLANMVPLSILIYTGHDLIEILLYSQVVLSLMIPVVAVPLVLYSSRRDFMREYRNRTATTLFASLSLIFIIVSNVALMIRSLG